MEDDIRAVRRIWDNALDQDGSCSCDESKVELCQSCHAANLVVRLVRFLRGLRDEIDEGE